MNNTESGLGSVLSKEDITRVISQLFNPNGEIRCFNSSDEELIGPDDDEFSLFVKKSEVLSENVCKNILNEYSISVNKKNANKMNTFKFSADELSVITKRVNDIHSKSEKSRTLKEDLVSYYMGTDATITKEEAETVIQGLMSGVDNLTVKYRSAIEEGWNPKTEISAIVSGMTLQQRYDFLVNAISIVSVLNVQTLSEISDIRASVDDSIKTLSNNNEVTESLCDNMQEQLSELLSSSSLMLTNADQVKELMSAAGGQTTTVVDFTSSLYDDYRYKNEMALAAWIEHKEGNLASLPDSVVPESLGVSIAAGVEEAHIFEQMANGTKTMEWVVKCLKVLGAVAMICFLGYIAIMGVTIATITFFDAAILIMGTSTAAIIVASVLSFVVCWGLTEVALSVGTKIVEWSCEAYDWVEKKVKDSVYPTMLAGFTKFISWVRSFFRGNGGGSAADESQVSLI